MVKTKSIGKESTICVEGTWDQISETVRVTRELMEDGLVSSKILGAFGVSEMEEEALRVYLVPQEVEDFNDYKKRVIQTFAGRGLKAKLASIRTRKKIPFYIGLRQNEGRSSLNINSIIREMRHDLVIGASGNYAKAGTSITSGLVEYLMENSIPYKERTIDRLI